MRAVKNHDAVSNATRLERRQDVRDRIAFLVRQEEEVLAEKRKRIEEMLWAIHEADIGDLWETYEAAKVGKDGNAETDEPGHRLTLRKQRPRLRKMLNIGGQRARLETDVSRLSDAERIQQLADQAKELGMSPSSLLSSAQAVGWRGDGAEWTCRCRAAKLTRACQWSSDRQHSFARCRPGSRHLRGG
jgi:hypothetical protein